VSNGKYAIYPVSSSDVLIEDSLAENASDAGLYVGQVSTCIVRNNVARGNVAGIEIENSTNCDVYGNTAESNTGGLLVFELPGLPMDGARTLVRDNVIRANNRVNFGDPTSVVGLVPTGTGIFILAANDIEIRDNTIEDNNGAALALVSYPIISALTGDPPPDDESYDPYSEGIWVHGNTFSGNGSSPGGQTASGANDTLRTLLGLMATQGVELTEVEEVAWDGFVRDDLGPSDVLCVRDNEGADFRYLDIPGLLGDDLNTNTDASPHDCMGPTQDEVDDAFASFAPAE
jgi:parallel beta-helix repeat protein